MPTRDEPLDLDALRYEPLAGRPSKVRLADLGRPPGPARGTLEDWLDGLPDDPGGQCAQASSATRSSRPMPGAGTVLAALGGHVIKTGCGAVPRSTGSRGAS